MEASGESQRINREVNFRPLPGNLYLDFAPVMLELVSGQVFVRSEQFFLTAAFYVWAGCSNAVRRLLPSRAMKDLAYIVVHLTARRLAGVSRPDMGSVAWDEWRVSYALAKDDSWYSFSADHRDYGCADVTGV